jgi:hypothetical protein
MVRRLAFLITFSVLIGAGALWMALFVGFSESDSGTLNAIAEWLSPEHIVGWIFYLALSAITFVPLARRFLGGTRDPLARIR